MSPIMSIVIIAIVIIALGFSWFNGKTNSSPGVFSENDFPLIPNDKGIVIEGPEYSEVKTACTDFCHMYNKNEYSIIIKLVGIDQKTSLLLFPYEIDFTNYCYLVNYLEYPINQHYQATVTGWLTAKKIDQWIHINSVNKKIMVYNVKELNRGDVVYYTSMDQKGYIIDFQKNSNAEEMESPIKRYISCEKDVKDLNNLTGELIA